MFVRLAGIVEESVVDGPGMRMSVFTQGCPRACPGCHNQGTHDPAGGYLESIDKLAEKYAENPLLAGMTFSGGEPFLQPGPLAALAAKIHSLGGNIVTYTGYVLEELLAAPMSEKPGVLELLAASDMLVDGPYLEALRSLELLFRGSSNQRLLNQKRSKIVIRRPGA